MPSAPFILGVFYPHLYALVGVVAPHLHTQTFTPHLCPCDIALNLQQPLFPHPLWFTFTLLFYTPDSWFQPFTRYCYWFIIGQLVLGYYSCSVIWFHIVSYVYYFCCHTLVVFLYLFPLCPVTPFYVLAPLPFLFIYSVMPHGSSVPPSPFYTPHVGYGSSSGGWLVITGYCTFTWDGLYYTNGWTRWRSLIQLCAPLLPMPPRALPYPTPPFTLLLPPLPFVPDLWVLTHAAFCITLVAGTLWTFIHTWRRSSYPLLGLYCLAVMPPSDWLLVCGLVQFFTHLPHPTPTLPSGPHYFVTCQFGLLLVRWFAFPDEQFVDFADGFIRIAVVPLLIPAAAFPRCSPHHAPLCLPHHHHLPYLY